MREAYEILRAISRGQPNEATRLAGEMHAGLQFGRVDTIFSAGLHEYLTEFLRRTGLLSDEVARTFFGAGQSRQQAQAA